MPPDSEFIPGLFVRDVGFFAAATGVGCACGVGSRLRPGAARAIRAGVREGASFRLTIGLGAVTVISGSCCVADGAAASCDIALPFIPNSSKQLAPLMWRARFTSDIMVGS